MNSISTIGTHVIVALIAMPEPIVIADFALFAGVAAVTIRVVLGIDFLN